MRTVKLAVSMLLLLTGLGLGSGVGSGTGTGYEEVERYDRDRAAVLAAGMCGELENGGGCRYGLEIRIREEREMPTPQTGAYTTRRLLVSYRPGEEGCSLTFTRESVQREDILAHEVCHCVRDYERIDVGGWKVGVGRGERERREGEADACARALMELP